MNPEHELRLNQCGQLAGVLLTPLLPPFPANWPLFSCKTHCGQERCCQALSAFPGPFMWFLNPPWLQKHRAGARSAAGTLSLPDGISLCPCPGPLLPAGCEQPELPQGPFSWCAQHSLASLVHGSAGARCLRLLTCCQLARNMKIPRAEQQSLPKDPPRHSARALPFLPSWDPAAFGGC